MIHGYHVIFGAYGFWLPNDPRGSWSDFVGAWELLKFGPATKRIERVVLTPELDGKRLESKNALKYPQFNFQECKRGQLEGVFAHPLSDVVIDRHSLPTPWNSRCWRVYPDSEEAIENAICYVEQNPINESKPMQKWSFENPFRGLDNGWTTYH